MVNLEFLSKNLTIILSELINLQRLSKYVSYDVNTPQAQPDLVLPAKDLVMNRIYPFPFDPVAQIKDSTQVRVYYPKCDFHVDSELGTVEIYFDIIVANALWLINENGESQVRPYMVVNEIMNHFNDQSISTLGKLHFDGFIHVNVNEKFDCIRLVATMELFGNGNGR